AAVAGHFSPQQKGRNNPDRLLSGNPFASGGGLLLGPKCYFFGRPVFNGERPWGGNGAGPCLFIPLAAYPMKPVPRPARLHPSWFCLGAALGLAILACYLGRGTVSRLMREQIHLLNPLSGFQSEVRRADELEVIQAAGARDRELKERVAHEV